MASSETALSEHRSAFAALVGRPSAGKSTLMNRLCGAKVAITSPVPQTTRNTIRGIVNRPDGQLVFIDTPGRHLSEKKLNRRLVEASERALSDADLVLYLLDLTRGVGPEEEAIAERLSHLSPQTLADKTLCGLNKCDALPEKRRPAALAEAREFLRERLPALPESRVLPLSALTGEGTGQLLDALFALAPAGPAWYDKDCYTDQDIRFRVSEIIREKAMARLREELPHAIYVDVTDAALRTPKVRGPKGKADKAPRGETDEARILSVQAVIYVEHESQKGMVVGKGGAMVRAIRLAALKDLAAIFDWKVELDLRVKTAPDWRADDKLIRRLTQ